MCVCVCVCVCAQSCLTLCDPMDCSPPGSSVHGISQVRILEWAAVSFRSSRFLLEGDQNQSPSRLPHRWASAQSRGGRGQQIKGDVKREERLELVSRGWQAPKP